ncbi:NepR family anti-sigma factor [Celeribacter sp.]|uniref:NepR family anti-sigma factor n=1 Tax=Celeribacter sp. TaxID=1890673 RepID=UPI003A901614
MSQNSPDDPIEAQIAENLRRAFKQRADEAVPDKFHDLLQQLRQQDNEPPQHASQETPDA